MLFDTTASSQGTIPDHPVLRQHLCKLSNLALCLAPPIVLAELPTIIPANGVLGRIDSGYVLSDAA